MKNNYKTGDILSTIYDGMPFIFERFYLGEPVAICGLADDGSFIKSLLNSQTM